MIVDTSAVVALLRAEPEAPDFAEAIADTPIRKISAANHVEAAVVMDSARDPIVSRLFDEFVNAAELHIGPVQQAKSARQSYRDFGKGSRHAAGLNFGDRFAYALAKQAGEPLLLKGNDFTHTDVIPARSP